MIKYLLFVFLLLLVSIWLGITISAGSGYVLITYSHWQIETSLWVAVISLIIAFILLYVLVRTLGRMTRIKKQVQRWRRMRRYRKARYLSHLGLNALAEGNWQRAEHQLTAAAALSKYPLHHYLAAATAANHAEAYDRRDQYLQKAFLSNPHQSLAISLTQANLQIDNQQWEAALATLQHIHQNHPHHRYTLKLLSIVYLKLKDWVKLDALLPSLKKYNVESEKKFYELEKMVMLQLLANDSKQGAEALHRTWNAFSRRMQQDLDLIHAYVSFLLTHHEDAEVIKLIEHTLKKTWDPRLVEIYGLAKSTSPAAQLTKAETWLTAHPKSPELLLSAARLSKREKFWGKARDYLQSYLQIMPNRIGYQELAEVYQQLGDDKAALIHYQKALMVLR